VIEGEQLTVAGRSRVLLRDARSELDVRANRFAEGVVVGQTAFVESLQVQGDEALPLLPRPLWTRMRWSAGTPPGLMSADVRRLTPG
jgi:hypothetical protein